VPFKTLGLRTLPGYPGKRQNADSESVATKISMIELLRVVHVHTGGDCWGRRLKRVPSKSCSRYPANMAHIRVSQSRILAPNVSEKYSKRCKLLPLGCSVHGRHLVREGTILLGRSLRLAATVFFSPEYPGQIMAGIHMDGWYFQNRLDGLCVRRRRWLLTGRVHPTTSQACEMPAMTPPPPPPPQRRTTIPLQT
jgi:hypothetical protein